MQKLFALAGLLVVVGCTEKIPNTSPRVEGSDTTFMASVETPEARRILLEEFTGVTCPNCPTGHDIVAFMQSQNPDRILAISYYSNGLGQARPVKDVTRKDFRTQDATDAGNSVFGGVNALPTASIDRVPVSNAILTTSNNWPGAVAGRLGVPSPANVDVSSIWESATNTASITVRVAYTSAVAKKQALTLALVENGIVDAQEYPSRIDTFYKFKHVLRDILTPVSGEAILNEFGTKEAGRVYERRFIYTVSPEWNADSCSLIAILHNAESGDIEVVQAADGKLK